MPKFFVVCLYSSYALNSIFYMLNYDVAFCSAESALTDDKVPSNQGTINKWKSEAAISRSICDVFCNCFRIDCVKVKVGKTCCSTVFTGPPRVQQCFTIS